MANYPFRINIVGVDGHKTAYYTASLATNQDTAVSSSVMLDKILLMPSASFETEESGSTHMALGNASYDANRRFQNYTEQPGKNNVHLSASVTHPNTGSIIFHDRESTQNGGLDYYEFYGSKVCSVLGLPEGIRIRPENFKFSDDASNPGNYMSGDLISDSIQLKEGFKMSPQARMRSNLIWDDAFGEGFIQWVSGSVQKSFFGYNNVRNLYHLYTSQITASKAEITEIAGTLFGNATSATTATNLSLGTINLGSAGTINALRTNTSGPTQGYGVEISASTAAQANGGDIVLGGGHNLFGSLSGGDTVRGGSIIVRPGLPVIDTETSSGPRRKGSFVVSGSSEFTGDITGSGNLAITGDIGRGMKQTFPFGYAATFSNSVYMRTINGVNVSGTRGYVMHKPGKILAVTFACDVTSITTAINAAGQAEYSEIKISVTVNGSLKLATSNISAISTGTDLKTSKSQTIAQAISNGHTFSKNDVIAAYATVSHASGGGYVSSPSSATLDEVTIFCEVVFDE